jgi:glyoxylase-like metal-dependent hydrolase (beta-lactamase superfamily II)
MSQSEPRPPHFAMPFPGIFRITCPTPFSGLPHVHIYVAEGPQGGLVLFDTAMPYQDSFDRVVSSLEWLGRKLTDIEAIYLTHAHPDHFGNAGALQEASGAPVICHPFAKRALEAMSNPDPDRFRTRMTVYEEFGRTVDEFAAVERAGAASFFGQMKFPTKMTTIDEGDVVTFARSDWDIYWTPGHEEGHVVFHRRSDGVIIVGDTVLWKITPHIGWMLEPPDPLAQFLDSLEKVAQLNPFLVLPGHGRPFEDGASRARAIAAHHRQRLRRCMEILMHRGALQAMDVARDLFDRELMSFEERLALAETLSHLEYLRLRGRLHREMVDGVWVYEMPSVVP